MSASTVGANLKRIFTPNIKSPLHPPYMYGNNQNDRYIGKWLEVVVLFGFALFFCFFFRATQHFGIETITVINICALMFIGSFSTL